MMGYENFIAADATGQYRSEFPVTQQIVYLNHAAVAPLCRPAADAMQGLVDDAMLFGSLHYDRWMACYPGLRQAAPRLMNTSPAEIAIIKNTSEGVSVVANGFRWRPGDRIIAFE